MVNEAAAGVTHYSEMGAVPAMPHGITIPYQTISIGVVLLKQSQTGKQLLAEADKALSRAKTAAGTASTISGAYA